MSERDLHIIPDHTVFQDTLVKCMRHFNLHSRYTVTVSPFFCVEWWFKSSYSSVSEIFDPKIVCVFFYGSTIISYRNTLDVL